MKFLEGEQVLAKMPSSQEFEKARILTVKGSKFKVLFKGGVEHTVNEADLKPQRTSRSQTRSKGRTVKSSSRNSPSRKSPARKSPARSPNAPARKIPVRSGRQAKISIARLEIPKDNSSDTDRTEGSESLQDEFVEPSVQSRLRETGPITRRSIRIMSGASKAIHEQKLMALRGIDRAVSLPVERKAQYNAPPDGKDRGLSVQRDDTVKMMNYEEDTGAETGFEVKNKEIDLISKPQEWGGWIGTLLLTPALPIYVILLQLACLNNCDSKSFRIPQLKEWKLFLNFDAFLLYGGFLCFISVMSVLPIGRLVDGQQSRTGRLQYRISGLWILILALAVFGGCIYQGYNIDNFLLKKSLPLSVTGFIYGLLLALVLYIKANFVPVSNLNIYGSTNNIIYDFWQGREVNPRIGPLDIKVALYRTALIGTIIINLSALVKIIRETQPLEVNNLHIAAILITSLQIIYLLDFLIFESYFITSFEVIYEGTGYMLCVGYLMYPYVATITTKYVIAHKAGPSIYLLVPFIVCFILGYFTYRVSNSQKNEFRKNPFATSLSHLETVPTKRGKRLIVSGLWGHVRHPNYLGDIIMHWSIACLLFTTDLLPYIPAIQLTLLLIHRAVRDNARCHKRYGYAWEQYCSRVKYMIFKRVF